MANKQKLFGFLNKVFSKSNSLFGKYKLLTTVFVFIVLFVFATNVRYIIFADTYYSSEAVATHNSSDSCWIVVKDKSDNVYKVYDITSYLNIHPAGKSIIIPSCGAADATNAFKTSPHSHSTYAWDLLRGTYYLGLFGAAPTPSPTPTPTPSPTPSPTPTPTPTSIPTPTPTPTPIPTPTSTPTPSTCPPTCDDTCEGILSKKNGHCDASTGYKCVYDLIQDCKDSNVCTFDSCKDKGLCVNFDACGGLVPCGRLVDNPSTTTMNETAPCTLCHLTYLIDLVLDFISFLAAIIAVLAIVIVGFQFITSSGNEQQRTKAKNNLKWILTGFIVIFIAWLLVDFLFTAWGFIDPLGGKWNVVCE